MSEDPTARLGQMFGEAYGLILGIAQDDSRSIAEHVAAHQADQHIAREFIRKWTAVYEGLAERARQAEEGKR